MRSRTATLRLTPCLLAAAVCLLLDAKPVAASTCGDYVHVRTPGQQTSDDHHPPPADSPCAHGRCDRGPIAPPAPEPTAPAGGGQDALLVSVLVCPPPAAFGYADADGGLPSRLPSAPFHPPRV